MLNQLMERQGRLLISSAALSKSPIVKVSHPETKFCSSCTPFLVVFTACSGWQEFDLSISKIPESEGIAPCNIEYFSSPQVFAIVE